MTMAIGRFGPNGRVWEVAGSWVSAWEKREVRGRSEEMGRGRAQACDATMPVMACLDDMGASWPG
jgi:hypothetical protein